MRSIFHVFEGFQLLDLSGPAGVFAAAADTQAMPSGNVVVSAEGGPVRSTSGIEVATVAIRSVKVRPDDHLFVVGGDTASIEAMSARAATGAWFKQGAAIARRYGSICTGALALGAWGLLDGHRATTHWRWAKRLAELYPKAKVDAEAMFIADGRLWTSAGVTTGIDMALAIVEAEVGARVANSVARRLVLSVRRPGNQSQFSPLLDAQAGGGDRYGDLIGHIAAHPAERLDVETLAAMAGESPRSFHRHFTAATGKTPAAFVNAARLERARTLIADGAPLKTAAAASGFASPEHLTRRFTQAFGLPPGVFRTMHASQRPIASAPFPR